jgi:amino acid transporter
MAADRPRLGAVVALGLGALAVIGATVVGWNQGVLDVLVTPPPLIRAGLVGGGVALGVVLLTRSVGRLAEAGERDVPGLIRAVRLAFLAVAAFAAAAGWAIGHPLPLVIAAVIAGIDVIETSFLLLTVGRR